MEDVRLVGPGVWFMIHKAAAEAVNGDSKTFFLETLKFVLTNYPCENCKVHLENYIEKNSLQKYINSGGVELLRYTWLLHNTVNKRLRKPQITFEKVKNYYIGVTKPCNKGCGGELVPTMR